jgi:PAS domain-containing protein
MNTDLLATAGFLREVFDSIPAMLLVVDEDVRILHLNATASAGLGLNIRDIHHKRGGEALHCVHENDAAEGCGRGEACRDCIIRNAVNNAVAGGKTFRKAARMELLSGGTKTEIHLLVTAAPFRFEGNTYVLLTLENISELVQLKSLLPICMNCKKVKNDEGYWNDIAVYLNQHLDVDFSHGLCADCMAKLYPEYKGKDDGEKK